MRRTKNVLIAPCAKPVASTATRARFRFWRSEPRSRRTVSPTARSMVWSSRRCKKRYRGEVGHTHQPQHLAQFAMLAQTHLGFTKGPVFVTHQAENGQQLRLGKLTFAETASVAREHRPGDLQSDAGKRQESDFGHRTSCLHRKPRCRSIVLSNFNEVARMSTEPAHLMNASAESHLRRGGAFQESSLHDVPIFRCSLVRSWAWLKGCVAAVRGSGTDSPRPCLVPSG